MKPKRFLSAIGIAVVLAGVLPLGSGCADVSHTLANRPTEQPQRMPAPYELPQIYRNY